MRERAKDTTKDTDDSSESLEEEQHTEINNNQPRDSSGRGDGVSRNAMEQRELPRGTVLPPQGCS